MVPGQPVGWGFWFEPGREPEPIRPRRRRIEIPLAAVAAVDDSSDYGIRHAVRAPAYVDYGVRHPVVIAFTDTFRLTGPSRVGIAPKQDFTDTFRLTGPSQLDDEDDWDGMVYGPPGR